MLQRIALVTTIGFCCMPVCAEPPTTRPTTAPNYVDNANNAEQKLANDALLKKLEKIIPEVRLHDVKLSEAIELLRKESGLQIFVDWKPLKAAGIEKDLPLTLHLKDKRLATFLWLTLEIAGAEREKLVFGLDGDYIVISTVREMAKNTITRVYDLHKVIDAPGGPGRNVRVEAVFKLLKDAVDPESWRDRDGTIGSMRELQGQLVVTQTPENQAKIAALCKNLVALEERGQRGK